VFLGFLADRSRDLIDRHRVAIRPKWQQRAAGDDKRNDELIIIGT